jgi:predicted dehydrogenase
LIVSPDAFRIGIVGYGLAGSVFHAPLVAATPGLAVTAIVTSNPGRQEEAAKQYPAATTFPDPAALFSRARELDAVVIATPNPTHASLAEAALDHGLHVVVDKPLARSAAEGRRIVDASARARRLLTVFHNRRWDGDFLTVRKLIADGSVGDPVCLESRYERFRPERRDKWHENLSVDDGGGILNDLGPHVIDQALVLFGPPTSVYAEIASRRRDVTVDDDVFVALRFAGGQTAHLWISNIPRLLGPRFRLVGMRGVYEKRGIDPQEDQLRAGLRPGDERWGRTDHGRLVGDAGDAPCETLPGCYEAFYAQLRDALAGRGPVPVDPDDAVRVLEVIEQARRS